MSEKSPELEMHLKQQANMGEQVSEGSFTLSEEEALKKLAEFQLPFQGAWILKVVQAVVASGSQAPIRVRLKRSKIEITFELDEIWDPETVRQELARPQRASHPGIQHLKVAFWAVGLGEKRLFELYWPKGACALQWHGQELVQTKSLKNAAHFLLSVSHAHSQEKKDWISQASENSMRNQNLEAALMNHCFFCPLPLWLNNQRVDAVQVNPRFGWSENSEPMCLGYADWPELPRLSIPSGSFLSDKHLHQRQPSSGKVRFSSIVGRMKPRGNVAAMVILSRYWKTQTGSERKVIEVPATRPSRLGFVKHGVVVQQQTISPENRADVGINSFVCADDLEEDLSSLSLRENAEFFDRVFQARAATAIAVRSLQLKPMREHIASRQKLLAGIGNSVGALAGGGALYTLDPWVITFVGICYGAFRLFSSSSSAQKDQLSENIDLLQKAWDKALASMAGPIGEG